MSATILTLSKASIEKRPGCIESALQILGDKWSPLLLSSLADHGKTFGELEILLGGISPRTLSSRLEKLQCNGVLDKTLYNAHPPRYKYELTLKGQDLVSILREMADWGNKYHASKS